MGVSVMAKSTQLAGGIPAGVTFAASLSFEHIHHAYDGGVPILSDISLSVEPGEVLCLLGPSGSGKTTLLRIAAGIEVQSAGKVLLNDREIAGDSIFVPPEQRSIGLVFQDFALFPHLSIIDNVRFGLTALSRAEAMHEAMIALTRVGLERYANAYPHILSGGEQQRVALARALAPRPAVVLMDEPFSGLDSRLKDSVRAETLAVLHQSRATTIVVTHDAEEAMRMGDRIALLNNGKLVQVGTAEELYQNPADLFVAGFFSELNVFEAPVENGSVNTPLGRFAAKSCADGTMASVAIRLAGIEVGSPNADLTARVVSRRFLGETEVLEIAIPGAESRIRARVRRGELMHNINEIGVSVRKSDVLVFERRAESA